MPLASRRISGFPGKRRTAIRIWKIYKRRGAPAEVTDNPVFRDLGVSTER
jgi:hypothetical protein